MRFIRSRESERRRVRSALVQSASSDRSASTRRHSAFAAMPPMPAPPAPPPAGSGHRVVILALRGVAVDAVCARLRRIATSADMHYVWVAASAVASDTTVASKVRALHPSVLVLAFDVAKVLSFDAVLRWDSAMPKRLPRVWAALSARSERVALAMTDVRDAAHCLGSRRTTVEVRLGSKVVGIDTDVRRLADAVTRCFLPPKPPPLPAIADVQPERARWALFRQCI